jgi:hypothetical protein
MAGTPGGARQTLTEQTEQTVWDAWNAVVDNEPGRVKHVAAELNMSPVDVARIVYRAEICAARSEDKPHDDG